jgi:hypothetical protein
MTRVTVRIEGHYEVVEAPFSRSYKWHPASVTLVCDCGEELTLTGASTPLPVSAAQTTVPSSRTFRSEKLSWQTR